MADQRQLRNLIFNLGVVTAALAIAFTLTVFATPTQAQTFKILHNFTGGQDGGNPKAGVTLDKGGNLYGTAAIGGTGYGTVYKLTHKGTFNPLFSFNNGDGATPLARVVFGPDGLLWGTTGSGGSIYGTVFKMRPSPTACTTALCPWIQGFRYTFSGPGNQDGWSPGYGDLTFDQAGNTYGTTAYGGQGCSGDGCGTVFEVSASGVESILYMFSGSDGLQPVNGVIFDNAGNLYGTTSSGGLSNFGAVFELTKSIGWTETCINSFRNGSDGSYLYAGLIFDQSAATFTAPPLTAAQEAVARHSS